MPPLLRLYVLAACCMRRRPLVFATAACGALPDYCPQSDLARVAVRALHDRPVVVVLFESLMCLHVARKSGESSTEDNLASSSVASLVCSRER